jgi:hypothetical protein
MVKVFRADDSAARCESRLLPESHKAVFKQCLKTAFLCAVGDGGWVGCCGGHLFVDAYGCGGELCVTAGGSSSAHISEGFVELMVKLECRSSMLRVTGPATLTHGRSRWVADWWWGLSCL